MSMLKHTNHTSVRALHAPIWGTASQILHARRNRVLACGFDLGNTILRDDLCTTSELN